MKYVLLTTAILFVGAAHAGDKLHMDEMDIIMFGNPVFNGYTPPVVASDSEGDPAFDKPAKPVPYLDLPKLHGPRTPQERIDAGHSSYEDLAKGERQD